MKRPPIAVLPGISIFLIAGIVHAQPPALTQEDVRNAASRMPPSLPGGALAPGTLFTIGGLRLAGARTRVVIRRATGESEAQVISAGPEHIEARMPAQIAPGDAALMVIRDGETSRPFQIRVAASAFGIYSRNGLGHGPGEIFNSSGSSNSLKNPGAPGAEAMLQGTGLGLDRSPEVYVGGRRARVVAVDSCSRHPGVDEVHFQLSKQTPAGCYVPVVVKTIGSVSNTVSMAVGPPGEPCRDTAMLADASGTEPSALLLLARFLMHVQLRTGVPVDFVRDIGGAVFSLKTGMGSLLEPWQRLPPAGTCTAYAGRWAVEDYLSGAEQGLSQIATAVADAGPRISVTGPRGKLALESDPRRPGFYGAALGGGVPLMPRTKAPFLMPGMYRISGEGGQQIGPLQFEGSFDAALDWRHPQRLKVVDRARGVTVEWKGAGRQERVLIVAANVDRYSSASGFCVCVAPGEAGRWRLPPLMLANLPPSSDVPGMPMNYLFLATLPPRAPPRFQTRGAGNGVVLFTAVRGRTVKFE